MDKCKNRFSREKVELGSLWGKKESRWENEILIESTSDNFVENFFKNPTAIEKGLSLLPMRTVEVISKGKWHLCEVIKTNKDMLKVRRCQDGKIADVSIKKTKMYRNVTELTEYLDDILIDTNNFRNKEF